MDANDALRKALAECRTELLVIERETMDAYAAAYGDSVGLHWGHVGDANRLLADLKAIRRYWATNTVAK